MPAELSWFVLLIRAQFAGRVTRSLRERSISFFAPQTLNAAGHKCWLFPSYIFALLWEALEISGMRYVHRTILLSAPDAARVRALRERARDNVILLRDQARRLQRGDAVIIRGGPFAGQFGTFDGMTHGRARVLVNFLAHEAKAEVPLHHLELWVSSRGSVITMKTDGSRLAESNHRSSPRVHPPLVA